MNLRIALVDDEAPARARLHDLLDDIQAQCPHTLVSEFSDARQLLGQFAELTLDVILLDVQMPGMNGIELARHFTQHQHDVKVPAIIFITAYDEFAVQAFEVQAIDYLLKPVRRERLTDALMRVHQALARESSLKVPDLAQTDLARRRHFSVLERGKILLIPVEDVIYLKAEQKYLTLKTRQRDYLLEESLSHLEQEFAERFVRIHRNALVAKNAIIGVEKGCLDQGAMEVEDKSSEVWLVLLDGVTEKLPISRRQWATVKSLVKK